MANTTIKEEIERHLDELPTEEQQRVLEFVQSLAPTQSKTPPGVPGKDLLQFGGFLSDEEADAMLQAIEEGCERVDHAEDYAW